MVLWMNNPFARRQLLVKGRVYTLRSKPYRLKGKLTEGTDVLMWETFGGRGKVRFTFLKKAKSTDELREYRAQSGFSTLDKWLEAAGKSRCLFLVEMIEQDGRPKYV